MARHLRGAGVRKEITVLVPGVDRAFVRVRERRIARPTTEAPRLLTVANAHPGKGLIEGLRALAALPTPWRWAIAGSWETEPDYARAFEAEARALGVHDRIERLGTVAPDVILRELSSADVFLLPSRFENQSLAVLEAVAAGVPILTTRTGENATWVLDHLTGRLVDAGAGMEDELRAAVGEILADPVTLGRYERNSARAPVPVGTWEQAAQAWIDRFSPGDRRARRADGSSAST
jgi:glycosyltransferase involved in cell wall biosynthesis